ncbi:HD-GYP domain-containing protein [Azospirillum sp. sgz302134]
MQDRSLANRVSGAYAIAGGLWILLGSEATGKLFGSNIAAQSSFEILKGLFFIATTALALRWLLGREMKRRNEADAERVKATRRLTLLLDQSVEALSHTLSQRDPYTAGHQERVAALSVAIARRMGLAEDRVAAIRTGALLHDVGKIGIPAEILSKPGRLSADEFNLVKSHARIGGTIVGKIDFESAIHAVVSQHHERLDGTGYPQGLRGDAIAVEARIVAVADVVEAMTSHRPYRPALGVEAAEAEIRALRGAKLDAGAVDACLAIIAEGLDRVWPGYGKLPADLRPMSLAETPVTETPVAETVAQAAL